MLLKRLCHHLYSSRAMILWKWTSVGWYAFGKGNFTSNSSSLHIVCVKTTVTSVFFHERPAHLMGVLLSIIRSPEHNDCCTSLFSLHCDQSSKQGHRGSVVVLCECDGVWGRPSRGVEHYWQRQRITDNVVKDSCKMQEQTEVMGKEKKRVEKML